MAVDDTAAKSGQEEAGAPGGDTDRGATSQRRRRAPVRPREGSVGHTLRTVYQQTVNEDVPSEMLDLLGKLA